jgi:glycolate oxidase
MMNEIALEKLRNILGNNNVSVEREQILNYLVDETPIPIRPHPAADVVLVKPRNTEDVSRLMIFANEHQIPIYPRGGGTGLAGGAIPTRNGIILSLEQMNKIEIDTGNMMAIAEAGVTLSKLDESATSAGLSFPPHPGDENAQIGGLVATNAGGSRAVKHGIMRNQVRELEIVLPTGEILNLGRRVRKNNVGYDLMQLIIGSEETLAVITKATIQLYSEPAAQLTLIIPYDNRHSAISTVPKMIHAGISPLAVEYAELDLLKKTAEHLNSRWPVTQGNCCLIVILEAADREGLFSEPRNYENLSATNNL